VSCSQGLILRRHVLGITLFEDPLVRSYILADGWSLIRKLSSSQDVVIFTTSVIKDYLVKKFPSDLEDKVSFAVPPLYLESSITKLLGFLLRYSENSLGNKRLRHINFEKGIYGIFGLYLRSFVNIVFASRPRFVLFLRFLYVRVSAKKLIRNFIYTFNLDSLFITSLTNWSEDIQVACAAQSLKIKTIGTPRSWDNLVSHGSLRFIPSTFLAHSEYMKSCASKYQHIFDVVVVGTSTYRSEFLRGLSDQNASRLGYGCVGPNSHPGERAFLDKLHDYLLDINFIQKFLIIQHPRFPHLIPNPDKYPKFEFKTFHFMSEENDNLHTYYKELNSLSILFTSGSTIALDALFVGTRIVCTNFDLLHIPFWQSASRYFSHRTHFRDLVSHNELLVLTTWEEFRNFLEGNMSSDLLSVDLEKVSYFTGLKSYNFENAILNILSN
jgi:hypothetical protein